MSKLDKILVHSNITVKDALKQMDIAAEKILIVVDKNNIIEGVVTDGDLRRWILNDGNLKTIIKKVMNINPICVNENFDINDVKEIMNTHRIECVPVIDKKKKFISAIFWHDLFKAVKPAIKKLIFLLL